MIRYFIITMIVVTFHEINILSSGAEQGLYEAVLHNISSCVVAPPWYRANVTLHTSRGRKFLRGAGFTERELKDFKFHIQMFYLGLLGDKAKVKMFEIKNQKCRNAIVQLVMNTLGIRYDSKKCIWSAGAWEFSGLDVDSIIHKLLPSAVLGLLQARWEIYSSVPLMCLDVYIQFVPRKDTVANT